MRYISSRMLEALFLTSLCAVSVSPLDSLPEVVFFLPIHVFLPWIFIATLCSRYCYHPELTYNEIQA